jgi:hypothetical protein
MKSLRSTRVQLQCVKDLQVEAEVVEAELVWTTLRRRLKLRIRKDRLLPRSEALLIQLGLATDYRAQHQRVMTYANPTFSCMLSMWQSGSFSNLLLSQSQSVRVTDLGRGDATKNSSIREYLEHSQTVDQSHPQ